MINFPKTFPAAPPDCLTGLTLDDFNNLMRKVLSTPIEPISEQDWKVIHVIAQYEIRDVGEFITVLTDHQATQPRRSY